MNATLGPSTVRRVQPPLETTYVLHEHSRAYEWEGVGPLSIKSFFNGRALYDAGGGRFAVDNRSYLILNHEQPYQITIESAQPVESFCIFFAAGFVEEVFRSLVTRPERLLDEPESCAPPLVFFDRTYPHDDVLSAALLSLRRSLEPGSGDSTWLTEQLHEVAARLLQVHQQTVRQVEAVPAVRATTREELYRRLHRARDYAAASFREPITLDQLAQVAGLSPNHLLRTWKLLFHQTPHQFVTSMRLVEAQRLLAHTDLPVTEVCLAVGFESLGSFSSLFRQRVGISPGGFRHQRNATGEARPLLAVQDEGSGWEYG